MTLFNDDFAKSVFQTPCHFTYTLSTHRLLTYHNYTLTKEKETISYYGIHNHSCILLCISEYQKPKKKKKKKQKRRASQVPNAAPPLPIPLGPPGGPPGVPAPIPVGPDGRPVAPPPPSPRPLPGGNFIIIGAGRNSLAPQPTRHVRAASVQPLIPTFAPNAPPAESILGGISGIDPNGTTQSPLIPAIAPYPGALGLAQSKSESVEFGLYAILNDTSKPLRERVNNFTRKLSIRRVTDLDIYTFDMDSNCLHMGCGHGMPKETLFAYAEAQFKEGQKSLKCPHLKNPDQSNDLCKRPWPS